jgi:hypothetical protein
MHLALKLFFFVFAVQPGVVYPLVDFYIDVAGRATEVFSALKVFYTDCVLIYLQNLSQ